MNSMGAFHEAAKIGFRYIETDVRATRNGVAVIQHDRKLAPESGVAGAVDQLTWPEVSTADLGGGEPIPTLEELLVALPQMRFNIDIKADSAVEVIERLQAHRRVLIASFSERRRQRALRLMSQRVASAAGMGAFLGFMAARTAGRRASAMRMLRDSDCLQLPARFGGLPVITPALVRSVHASRRQVHAWTIDDPAMMHALFDIGVDGIITDRADVLCDVLGARGEW